MSNYVKSTNFATKDNLSPGDALKIVKGTEINTEYDNIATAVATKADLASPTFTGTPTLPTGTISVTQSPGNSSTAISTTAFVQAAIALLYPVGSVYINATSSTNPGTLLGFGTWTAFGAGRVPVGFDSGNALFDAAEETGGAADAALVTHTHTATSTVTDPGHLHSTGVGGTNSATSPASVAFLIPGTSNTASAVTGITVATTTAAPAGAVSATNANYQPYITVYMWKRTV